MLATKKWWIFAESDSESMPSHSPLKHPNRQIKTLDEIKLEKIQAEAAAYYSYGGKFNRRNFY